MVEALQESPGAGLAGACLMSSGAQGGLEINQGTLFDWRTGRTRSVPPLSEPSPVDFCCGAMLLFRPDALREVGGFDSNLFLFYEEIDWAERARSVGYSVLAVPGARAIHLGSQSVGRAPSATAYYRARNRLVILRRYSWRHGAHVNPRQEGCQLARVLAGHLVRGRWSRIWPVLSGTVSGLASSLAWSDDPVRALGRQRWEAREVGSPRRGPDARRRLTPRSPT